MEERGQFLLFFKDLWLPVEELSRQLSYFLGAYPSSQAPSPPRTLLKELSVLYIFTSSPLQQPFASLLSVELLLYKIPFTSIIFDYSKRKDYSLEAKRL